MMFSPSSTSKKCTKWTYLRLTGEEEQIGGFDLIYKNSKRVKNGMKNLSFLGCLNNRMQQMPKLAKNIALKLA